MTAIKAYERGLIERLVAGLLTIPGLTFYGIREQERFGLRTPTVSFRIEGYTPRAVAEYLGKQGIFVWDGNYYALSLTERLGVEANGGMVRIGLVHYNTAEEVERLLEALAALKLAG
jgi:selenocysteine lyase/cysteine desulfurase